MSDYHPQQFDKKWQERWGASRVFEADVESTRPKFYCLEMFAYPSGHAHVGHVRNYIIGDVVARTKRMRGYNVLHPFGWDAFGLPAENAAIKSGIHPEVFDARQHRAHEGPAPAVGHQLRMGARVGDVRCRVLQVETSGSSFRMFEKKLAYRRRSSVNWCPSCNTVLANEQVIEGPMLALRVGGRDP